MIITCPKCSARYQIPPEINLKKGKKMQCSACQNLFEFQPTEAEEVSEKIELIPPKDAVLSVHSKTEKLTIKKIKAPADHPNLPEVFLPVQPERKSHHFTLLILSLLLLFVLACLGWIHRDFLMPDFSFSAPSNRFYPNSHHSLQKKYPIQKKTVSFSDDIPLIFDEDVKELPSANEAFSIQSVRFRKSPTEDALLIEGVLKNVSSESLLVPPQVYAFGYGADGKVLFEKEIHLSSGILHPGMEQAFFGTYLSKTQEVKWVDVVLEK